jgi:hypothetical protein
MPFSSPFLEAPQRPLARERLLLARQLVDQCCIDVINAVSQVAKARHLWNRP